MTGRGWSLLIFLSMLLVIVIQEVRVSARDTLIGEISIETQAMRHQAMAAMAQTIACASTLDQYQQLLIKQGINRKIIRQVRK